MAALKSACDSYRPDAYAEYKAWCDRYFYLPHRQEPRAWAVFSSMSWTTADVAADLCLRQSRWRGLSRRLSNTRCPPEGDPVR